MITDLDFTGLSLLTTSVDERLAALNRELRFVAGTLARVRQCGRYATVYSSKPGAHVKDTKDLVTSTLQLQLQDQSPVMLKRLFASPTKARFDTEDLESAPAVLSTEEIMPRRWNTVASRPTLEQHRRWTLNDTPIPRLELPPDVLPIPRRRPLPSARPVSCGDEVLLQAGNASRRPTSLTSANATRADTIPFIIDHNSQALFHIPRKHNPTQFLRNPAHQPKTITIQLNPGTDERILAKGIYLPNVTVAAFADFSHWTLTGRILPHPPATVDQPQEWYIEASARRLISALALAVSTLHSTEYAQAAVDEFAALGPLLDWPEDYVNSIFAATATPFAIGTPASVEGGAAACLTVTPHSDSKVFNEKQWQAAHPARRLLVALVAAKTHGPGRERQVRLGPRRKNLECEEEADTRIRSGTFWAMYDWFCEGARRREGLGEVAGKACDPRGTDNAQRSI
ncbi:hypothetical protein LTR91_002887 [Friedmanniomyces endolithicus]|uniref:Uncharacterized protein n=1 Tax=Friedmanniomyces endolithicus TaxID=329885 RepID=A0AAN6KX92_9PEZI|nr:hypothetical protein LTS02_013945 [Friedmanniomyces endolithicus]KAK0925938.1 hypothetical protein LTR57_004542 [Friedmanniomyces endolithicus]KAK0978464.1 hypothetical protein LTS01_012738 [Friedmanniomyces endolithicus]KAK1009237.1 hypothetical protein LTR91_002887 [Friedmanniomyces endolithicus]KAK1040288.1 hypothetical protein LTS16_010503 [Friedmanniomyces endolithicus]